MQKTLALVALATASLVHAQSPCIPPSTFTTTWASTTFAGAPNATNGSNVMFDLNLSGSITLSQIDTNFDDDGNQPTTPATPNLIGQTATFELWTTTTSWVGSTIIGATPGVAPAAWTMQGTGTYTVAAPGVPSACVFASPVTLPAGLQGTAVHFLPTPLGPVHPLYSNPAVNGVPTSYSDQFITFTGGGVQQNAWTSGTNSPRIMNLTAHYTPVAGSAFFSKYGAGCYTAPASFYEVFDNVNTFDLSNTTVWLINNGSTYTVTPVPTPLFTPTSTPITANPPAVTATASWDDALSAPISLPFTFSYPGGSTSTIIIGSNGHVFLGSSVSTGGFYSDITGFLGDQPRLAAFWGDLDPSAGGNIFYDVDPSGLTVYITWDQVPEWNVPTQINTFQIALNASGIVEYRYSTCGSSAANALVGFTPGLSATDPLGTDISATMPFNTGDGGLAPAISLDVRPTLGGTVNIITSDIRAGAPAGLLFLGFTPVLPGIDLGIVGMPGCSQYVVPVVNVFFLVSGATSSTPLSIPANPGLTGLQVEAQSAILFPGLNAAGILSSNGVCMHIGS
jgi:hypothetical protein